MTRKIFSRFLFLCFFLGENLTFGSPDKVGRVADELIFKRSAVPVRIKTTEDWERLAKDVTEFSLRDLQKKRSPILRFPILSLGDEFNLLDGPDFFATLREYTAPQVTAPDLFCKEMMPSSPF
jgi:hypothetical protein